MSWLLLYWPAAVLLMAISQGLLLPAIRRTPPGDEAQRQAFALHWLLTLGYFLPLAFAPATWLVALLSRVVFFEVTLNLFSGQPAFYVGQTALRDRLLRRLAPNRPEALSAALQLAALALAVVVVAS